MEPIISIQELSKRYGPQWAVKDLNLDIKQGEIYGFLGRNGAGKTTTIKMLLGLVRPTAGSIKIFGKELKGDRRNILRNIGTLIDTPGFYMDLSADENLAIFGKMTGMTDSQNTRSVLKLCGLGETGKKRVKEFSLGMKQRLGLARALLHNPEILILDEPSNGLDPVGIKFIRQLIRDLAKKKGMTVFISSHILSELQQTADRFGIIHAGKLVKEVSIAELHEMNRRYLELRVSDDSKAALILEGELSIDKYAIYPDKTLRVYSHLEDGGKINRALHNAGIEVSHLALSRDNLEDFFLHYTGEQDA